MEPGKIRYWVLDVDGTMTDGGVYYDDTGNEMKKFHVKDGAGIKMARAAGMKVIVLTGRECRATKRRMEELQIDFLFQNIKNKEECLQQFFEENGILWDETGYIGDDLNDLACMKRAGFTACPADACREVKQCVHYISPVNGGCGAVREIIEHTLRQSGEWEKMTEGLCSKH